MGIDLNIYLSEYYIFKNTNFLYNYLKDFNQEKYKSIKNYMSILKTKNSYYLKQKNQKTNNFEYLIISSIEFEFLSDYFMNNENAKKIDIYDKDGIKIIFNREKKKIEYENTDLEPLEYFIKYILGSDLKINEFFYMFNLIKNNGQDLSLVLKIFKLFNNTKYSFENFILKKDGMNKKISREIIKFKDVENFLNTLEKLNNDIEDRKFVKNYVIRIYNNQYTRKIFNSLSTGTGKTYNLDDVSIVKDELYKRFYIKISGIDTIKFQAGVFTDESQHIINKLLKKNGINTPEEKIETSVEDDENELIFNNETFYKLLQTELGFDISILSQNENIKEYLDNIEKQITEYLNKQDGGFNFINHLLKQLGGYKKNSRLHNGK